MYKYEYESLGQCQLELEWMARDVSVKLKLSKDFFPAEKLSGQNITVRLTKKGASRHVFQRDAQLRNAEKIFLLVKLHLCKDSQMNKKRI